MDLVRRDFLRLPFAVKADAFYAAWTRREAAVKARGGSIVLSSAPPAAPDDVWQLIDLPAGAGYSAALCYSGPEAEVFLWSPAAWGSAP